MAWTDVTPPASTFTDIVPPTSSFTDVTPPTSGWTLSDTFILDENEDTIFDEVDDGIRRE